jgi:hypothetical protein
MMINSHFGEEWIRQSGVDFMGTDDNNLGDPAG